MTLTHEVFLRRFLEHVLPRGFPHIRYFGFLANRRRGIFLLLCRTLLAAAPPVEATHPLSRQCYYARVARGPMRILEFRKAKQIRGEQIRQVPVLDTS